MSAEPEPAEAVMLVNRSASVERRILDHALKAEDTQAENTWKSMCMVMDRRAVQYFTQISIIGSVMMFCIFKLTTDTSCVADVKTTRYTKSSSVITYSAYKAHDDTHKTGKNHELERVKIGCFYHDDNVFVPACIFAYTDTVRTNTSDHSTHPRPPPDRGHGMHDAPSI